MSPSCRLSSLLLPYQVGPGSTVLLGSVPRGERDGALEAKKTVERWRIAVVALATVAALPLFALEDPQAAGSLTATANASEASISQETFSITNNGSANSELFFDTALLVGRAQDWYDTRAALTIVERIQSAAVVHEVEAMALAREISEAEYDRHAEVASTVALLRRERERKRLIDEEDARRMAAMTTSGPTTTIVATPPVKPGPSDIQWEALRYCESTGNYGAISPSGKYRGAYQFSVETWNWIAGLYYENLVDIDPAEAKKTDQDRMAQALYNLRGRGQWPVCGRYLP